MSIVHCKSCGTDIQRIDAQTHEGKNYCCRCYHEITEIYKPRGKNYG